MNDNHPDDTAAPMLERVRVAMPVGESPAHAGAAGRFFDVLDNNGGITEQYLYEHQGISDRAIHVYSTSAAAVGRIDPDEAARRSFIVQAGPAILVARKGYAGRMSVIEDAEFIVHEDGYAVRPASAYMDAINLWWFAGYYSAFFQSRRTSSWGIGDFPRDKFKTTPIVLPSRAYQDRVEPLYRRRARLVELQRNARDFVEERVMAMVLDGSPLPTFADS